MTGGVAVIIINYGTADLAIAGVESVLARDHGGRGIEVHLVDNASPGDDAARLKVAHEAGGWGDRVTLWCEAENHGFGRGNNVVLKALAARDDAPEFVFLLNPDARLENEAIAILADALDANPRAAVAGAGIALPDGTPVTAAFRFPSLTRELVSTINFGPLDRLLPAGRQALPPDRPAGPVDWVAGAAVLFRRDVIEAVGRFDRDFFLYFEEVELMRRIAQAGHDILYVPDAQVLHAEGAATEVRSGDTVRRRRPPYLYQSWRDYYLKAHGRGYAVLTAVMKIPAAALNITLAKMRGHRPIVPAHFFADHWRHALVPLLSGRGS